MSRHFTIALLGAAALVAGACDGDTPHNSIAGVEPRAADAFQVAINGPRLIGVPGSYQWTAEVHGGDGEFSYEWTLYGTTRPVSVTGTDGPVLSLALDDYFDGRLEISVVVHSGGEAVLASETVMMCPQRHAVDWCVPTDLIRH